MSWFQFQSPTFKHKGTTFLSDFLHSSSSLSSNIDYQKQSSSSNKISPGILLTIIIVSAVVFVSGLLYLLVKFLIKHRASSYSVSESNRDQEFSVSDTSQRQLQHLFHLHDSGLDQAYIDALPVFDYKQIIVMGLKEPFDCAVCLCEFTERDKLRLLPLCSHAFHIDCIDTWLLSNSTCPLCRGTLFTPGVPIENPVFNFEEIRGIDHDFRGSNVGQELVAEKKLIINSKRVFSVRLGRFRSSNCYQETEIETSGGGESSNFDARRCFSMGSNYQYVVADMDLQVTLCPVKDGINGGAGGAKFVKGMVGQNGNSAANSDVEGKKINVRNKGESFSLSKIWQWSKKDSLPSSSRTQITN